MRAWRILVAGVVLVAACGDEPGPDPGGGGSDSGATGVGGDPGGGGAGGDSGGQPAACGSLSVAGCGSRPDCSNIDGRPMLDDGAGGLCVDFDQPQSPLGCMPADMGCGDAETLAASADDPSTCWWFPSTCVPAGWSGCAISEYGECAR